MIAEILNENVGGRPGRGSRSGPRSRIPALVGIGLSILIHVIGLWLLIGRTPLVIKAASSNDEARMTVSLVPPVVASPAQPKMPEPTFRIPSKKSSPYFSNKRRVRKKAIEIDRGPANTPKAASPMNPPDAIQRNPSPSGDMFTQIEAARKRRADALEQAGVPAPDNASSTQERAPNDNSIALANIATSLRQARVTDRSNAGGVFELRRVGYQDAEFVFRGWSTSSRRNAIRLITVEQGTNVDIQTAIVKKIIDVIREEKQGDFLWESRRLGKSITLSARPQDSVELRQFLMREFFPDYLPAVP